LFNGILEVPFCAQFSYFYCHRLIRTI